MTRLVYYLMHPSFGPPWGPFDSREEAHQLGQRLATVFTDRYIVYAGVAS